jgi:hypothetical protein
VFDASFNFVGTAHVKINSNELKVRIPLSLIGNPDGSVDFATVLGSVCQPTDIAPNLGHGTTADD